MKYVFWILVVLVAALWIPHRMEQRYQEGVAHGVRTALHLPPSEALEVTCASLWIGEQAKKAQNK